jgi:hypothetical protein
MHVVWHDYKAMEAAKPPFLYVSQCGDYYARYLSLRQPGGSERVSVQVEVEFAEALTGAPGIFSFQCLDDFAWERAA